MQFINDVALDFDDVILIPQVTDMISRKDVQLETTLNLPFSSRVLKGIPIISANMSSVTTFSMAKVLAENNIFSALHKHYSIYDTINFYNSSDKFKEKVFHTIGISEQENYNILVDKINYTPMVCFDIANGGMKSFAKNISKFRLKYDNVPIMAGNVVTVECAKQLIDAGVDIIKIGVGSGANCLTRIVAGTGLPQLSAIMDTSDYIHSRHALLCSDGGLVHPGDFAKAYAAGADLCMAGGIFAGHDECESEVIEKDGKIYMAQYGMSSEHAMNKHNGGMNSYRSSEGKLTYIPYRGPVINTINHILGGIRSACTYSNVNSLDKLHKHAILRRLNRTHNKIFGE